MQRDLNPDRLDDGARADAEMKERETYHLGDPCIHCGTPHDDVAPGPCPGQIRWRCTCCTTQFWHGTGNDVGCPYCKAAAQYTYPLDHFPAALPAPQGDDTLVGGRDIYECANQLGGYVAPGTPDHLAKFLLREAEAASALADTIVSQAAEIAGLKGDLDKAIATIHAIKTRYETGDKFRAEAAESLLAEARGALEVARRSMPLNIGASPHVRAAHAVVDATLSRLKPGEKGGE